MFSHKFDIAEFLSLDDTITLEDTCIDPTHPESLSKPHHQSLHESIVLLVPVFHVRVVVRFNEVSLSLSLQHLKTTYMLERTRYSSTHSETKELTRTRFTLGSETRQFQRIFGSWCGFDRISAMPELVLCLGKNTDLNFIVARATG